MGDNATAVHEGDPVLVRLAEVLASIRSVGLSPDQLHAGARAIVDWFGATIAGSATAPAQALIAAVGGGRGGTARLVPSSSGGAAVARFGVRDAALVNATASHTVELDDIYREGVFHPGSPVVGAALAVAEHVESSGADLARAVVLGYEAGARIAEAVNPAHYKYWHTTGTVGTIAAAAAAADLLGASTDQLAHAMATATTMAAGLQQAFRSDSMSKPLHAGHAAEAGVLAALAAKQGFTGALSVLEGPVGFGAAMSEKPSWPTVVGPTGDSLAVQRMTVKNHACCGHTFAAVDGIMQLRSAGLRVEDVDTITVRTYTTATQVAGYEDPVSEFEAKFSIRYCMAAALVLGGVRLRAFADEALADPRIRACLAKITVVPDEELERAFPGQRKARVEVVTTDGRTLSADRDTRHGDPDDPLTDADLSDKFTDITEPVIGVDPAKALLAALWDVGSAPRVCDLSW